MWFFYLRDFMALTFFFNVLPPVRYTAQLIQIHPGEGEQQLHRDRWALQVQPSS